MINMLKGQMGFNECGGILYRYTHEINGSHNCETYKVHESFNIVHFEQISFNYKVKNK